MWAHAEYVKLLRSTADGKVYDAIPEVAKRYLGKHSKRKQLEVWKPNRHVRFMRVGEVLRIQAEAPFTLHWSVDNWNSVQDGQSSKNALEIDYIDLMDVVTSSGACIRFTFFWPETNRWEGQDYAVTVR
jgi:glucoamylase